MSRVFMLLFKFFPFYSDDLHNDLKSIKTIIGKLNIKFLTSLIMQPFFYKKNIYFKHFSIELKGTISS